jgi:hypothetical protein
MLFTTKVYVKLCGRYYRVLALALNDTEANVHMAENPGLAVIHVEGSTVLMGDKNDNGVKEI